MSDGVTPGEGASAWVPPERDELVRVGERWARQVRLSEDEIIAFATQTRDLNPMHVDREFAARSRFGRLIACGGHSTALLMGLVATHLSRRDDGVPRAALGMQFQIRFRDVVFADEDLTIEWTVVSRHWKERLDAWVVHSDVAISAPARGVLVDGSGTCLVRRDVAHDPRSGAHGPTITEKNA